VQKGKLPCKTLLIHRRDLPKCNAGGAWPPGMIFYSPLAR